MRRKLTAIVAGAMMVGSVSANDIKMSPVFDVSYMHSDARTTAGLNEGQYYNDRDDVDVQYAGIDFSGASKSLSWTLSLNFAGDSSNTQFVNQAFMSYAINDNLTFIAGRFYTFFGYEAMRTNGDWNYTKSIAKKISPNWHEGVGATWDAKNGFMASVFLVDGIANSQDSTVAGTLSTSADTQSSKKGVGATASYAMDKWKAEFDYYTQATRGLGEQGDTTHMAFNFKYDISDKFSAAFAAQQGTVEATSGNEAKYTSYAVYAKFQATEKFFAAARYEMFSEEKTGTSSMVYAGSLSNSAAITGNDHDMDSITLTGGYDLMNGSQIKLEYRMDSADKEVYRTGANGSADKTDDSNNTVALAWTFTY